MSNEQGHTPAGFFHSVTTRDAGGRFRDRQAVVDWNFLRDGTVEVKFADGDWMLCRPYELRSARFSLDSLYPRTWRAEEFGDPWNGWLTPVVTKAVLEDLLVAAEEEHEWSGDTVILEREEDTLEPREDGLYDLAPLGWTFDKGPQ